MSIAVVCSKCSAKLNAPDGAAGKKVKCPKCQAGIVVPEALAAEFEVVEEAKPVKKPAKKLEDDDDDRPRKKKRRDDDEDEVDEDRPRKKKRRDDDDDNEDDDDRPRKKKKRRKDRDDEGGVSMTRNIVMAVVLLLLIAVAAYVFYERSKEKDEKTTSNANPNGTSTPQGNQPLPKSGPDPAAGGKDGESVRQTLWTPDPNLVKELTQKGELAGYQFLLPEDLAEVPDDSPPNSKRGFWVAKTLANNPAGLIMVFVSDDLEAVTAARENMSEALYSLSSAIERKSKLRIDGRHPHELGRLNGLVFTRIVITGFTPNKQRMRGCMYGALDGDRFIAIIGIRYGESAPTETTMLETIVATFKKS